MGSWFRKSAAWINNTGGTLACHWAQQFRYLLNYNKDVLSIFDIAVLLRQLATLISAGIPIIQCCELLQNTQLKISGKRLIENIKQEIFNGKNLFDCLHAHPAYFNELTCQLIKIGEHTGKLDIMLNLIADQQEKNIAFRKRIQGALFYPCLISVVAFIITVGMFIFIIPRFAELFQASEVKFPFFTRVIFYLSSVLQKHIGLFSLPMLIPIALWCRFKSETAQLIYQIPWLKDFLQKIILMRFARQLAITFSAGIPISDALTLIAHLPGNKAFNDSVMRLRRHINAGLSLHYAMLAARHFPELMRQMIKIGEESGMLALMLNKVADFFESDIDRSIAQFTQLLEPLIMLVLGVLIGGIVIGMYLPIFQLGSAL